MKNNKLKSVLTVFSMLLCFSVFAQGHQGDGQGGGRGQGGGKGQKQENKPDASEIFSKLDTNKDDFIDKDEAAKDSRGKIFQDFDEIDSNEDGFIDLEELKASLDDKTPRKLSAEKILKQIDDNGDGTLNELEVAAKDNRELVKNFSTIDTNQDNELDLEELKTFYDKNDNQKPKRKEKKFN